MAEDGGGVGITGVVQVALGVEDMARSTAFYKDVLGLPVLHEAPGMALLDCGGVRLLLGDRSAGGGRAGTSVLYFRVGGLGAARAEITRRGAAVGEPHLVARFAGLEVRVAFFTDPDGNALALMSETREGEGEPRD